MYLITNSPIMGKNIAFIRRQQGLTREALGQMINIEELELRDIENGEVLEIDFDSLRILCSLFRLDADELLNVPMWDRE